MQGVAFDGILKRVIDQQNITKLKDVRIAEIFTETEFVLRGSPMSKDMIKLSKETLEIELRTGNPKVVELLGYSFSNVVNAKGQRISAGLVVSEGMFIGSFVFDGELLFTKEFVTEYFVTEVEDAVVDLAKFLKTSEIGDLAWFEEKGSTTNESILESSSQILRSSKNVPFILPSVLVDLGEGSTVFQAMVFAKVNEKFVVTLGELNRNRTEFRTKRECVFKSSDKGNYFYSKMMKSAFISKKGNTIYRLPRESTEDFKKVNTKLIVLREDSAEGEEMQHSNSFAQR